MFRKKYIVGVLWGLLLVLIFSTTLWAVDLPMLPTLKIGVEKAENPEQVSVLLQILFLLTVLSLAPAILVMMTSFTRLAVVFSLMTPVFTKINEEALQPYLAEEISQGEALEKALDPIRKFMFKQTRKKDLSLFMKISKSEKPRDLDEIPTTVLISSFVISELKTSFQIGFLIYIPFLVIDMVVASVLLSMGMMMLPPFMVSLPFKLMLFVLIDGWYLLVGSMVKSFS